MRQLKRFFIAATTLYILVLMLTQPFSMVASGWSNSGPSDDPANPNYGTHDWLAEHALDFLPGNEKKWLDEYRSEYLYGTELPDFQRAVYYPDGIGDQMEHHIYFNEDGSIMAGSDDAAIRAQEEFDKAVQYLKEGEKDMAARHAGIMTHYMADVAVFGHVMGYYTDWMYTRESDRGSEGYYNHMSYEQYVNRNTTQYESEEWDGYLRFDGSLSSQTAYQLTIIVEN